MSCLIEPLIFLLIAEMLLNKRISPNCGPQGPQGIPFKRTTNALFLKLEKLNLSAYFSSRLTRLILRIAQLKVTLKCCKLVLNRFLLIRKFLIEKSLFMRKIFTIFLFYKNTAAFTETSTVCSRKLGNSRNVIGLNCEQHSSGKASS